MYMFSLLFHFDNQTLCGRFVVARCWRGFMRENGTGDADGRSTHGVTAEMTFVFVYVKSKFSIAFLLLLLT